MKINQWAAVTVFWPLMMLGALTAKPDKAVESPVHKVESKSPLTGKWVDVLCMGNGDLPTNVHVVTIGKDGIFNSVRFQLIPGKRQKADGPQVKPAGAELAGYETGKINLETGEQLPTQEEKKMSVKSIHWSVENGRLTRWVDMGEMESDTGNFSKERDLQWGQTER